MLSNPVRQPSNSLIFSLKFSHNFLIPQLHIFTCHSNFCLNLRDLASNFRNVHWELADTRWFFVSGWSLVWSLRVLEVPLRWIRGAVTLLSWQRSTILRTCQQERAAHHFCIHFDRLLLPQNNFISLSPPLVLFRLFLPQDEARALEFQNKEVGLW